MLSNHSGRKIGQILGLFWSRGAFYYCNALKANALYLGMASRSINFSQHFPQNKTPGA